MTRKRLLASLSIVVLCLAGLVILLTLTEPGPSQGSAPPSRTRIGDGVFYVGGQRCPNTMTHEECKAERVDKIARLREPLIVDVIPTPEAT